MYIERYELSREKDLKYAHRRFYNVLTFYNYLNYLQKCNELLYSLELQKFVII